MTVRAWITRNELARRDEADPDIALQERDDREEETLRRVIEVMRARPERDEERIAMLEERLLSMESSASVMSSLSDPLPPAVVEAALDGMDPRFCQWCGAPGPFPRGACYNCGATLAGNGKAAPRRGSGVTDQEEDDEEDEKPEKPLIYKKPEPPSKFHRDSWGFPVPPKASEDHEGFEPRPPEEGPASGGPAASPPEGELEPDGSAGTADAKAFHPSDAGPSESTY
jgi:hypothetical protein